MEERERAKVTWGILGAAKIAEERLIPALQESQISELVAIASRDLVKARRFAKVNGIPKAYGSYDDLLSDPDIDVVYLPLPNHLHYEWTIKAAQAGKHVLCEKPLARSVDEAREMFAVCEANHVLLMEGLMYRFHPQTRRVKELLSQGTIGEPQLIRVAHSFPLHLLDRDEDFRWRMKCGGGSLLDLGVYCVDTARYLFADEPVRVFAVSSFHPDHSAEAETRGILEFPGNRVAMIDSSFLLTTRKEYEVVGAIGGIRAFDPYNPERGKDNRIEITIRGEMVSETIKAENEYRLEVDHFSRSVLDETSPAISRAESVANVRVLHALEESACRGIPLTIDQ